MWEWLNKLRQKPDHKKQQIALWISASITLVIVIVWFSTFTLDTQEAVATTSSPFDQIQKTIDELWAKKPSLQLPQSLKFK